MTFLDNDASRELIIEHFEASLNSASKSDAPYPHWLLKNLFPESVLRKLQQMTFPMPELNGVSGKRELHNDQRHYFDACNIADKPVVSAVSHSFQSQRMIDIIEDFFATSLDQTFLRIEYAQDATGFWLEPHTDLGVKRLTVLIYLSNDAGHETLGTDIFNADKTWAARSPFAANLAMAFVPGDNTYHGFQEREINGVRKSLILNYVTDEWRDREQLAFPESPVRTR